MKPLLLIALAMLIVGCESSSVDSYTDTCCPPIEKRTFTVNAEGIPAFLGPVMVSNFSVALATLGFNPVDADGELIAELRYEQEDMVQNRPGDDFDGRISPGGDVRFLAKMVIEIRDAATNEVYFRGGIHRLHEVSPGEFMHVGRASLDLLDAFDKALKEIPARPAPEL